MIGKAGIRTLDSRTNLVTGGTTAVNWFIAVIPPVRAKRLHHSATLPILDKYTRQEIYEELRCSVTPIESIESVS